MASCNDALSAPDRCRQHPFSFNVSGTLINFHGTIKNYCRKVVLQALGNQLFMLNVLIKASISNSNVTPHCCLALAVSCLMIRANATSRLLTPFLALSHGVFGVNSLAHVSYRGHLALAHAYKHSVLDQLVFQFCHFRQHCDKCDAQLSWQPALSFPLNHLLL